MSAALLLSAWILAMVAASMGQWLLHNTLYRDVDIITPNFKYTSQLWFDHNSNELYFDYLLGGEQTWHKKLGVVSLYNNSISQLPLSHDRSITYGMDVERKQLYIGGPDGIYKYDMRNQSYAFLGGENIWKIYFKSALYYRKLAGSYWHVYQNGSHSVFERTRDKGCYILLIDDDDVMYCANHTGLYRETAHSARAERIQVGDALDIRNMALDPDGRLYVTSTHGIYLVNNETPRIELIFAFTNDSGSSLSSGSKRSIFYSTWSSPVHKLVPNNYIFKSAQAGCTEPDLSPTLLCLLLIIGFKTLFHLSQ